MGTCLPIAPQCLDLALAFRLMIAALIHLNFAPKLLAAMLWANQLQGLPHFHYCHIRLIMYSVPSLYIYLLPWNHPIGRSALYQVILFCEVLPIPAFPNLVPSISFWLQLPLSLPICTLSGTHGNSSPEVQKRTSFRKAELLRLALGHQSFGQEPFLSLATRSF